MTSTLSVYDLETLPKDFRISDAFGRTWTKAEHELLGTWQTDGSLHRLSSSALAHFYGPLSVSPPEKVKAGYDGIIESVETLQALLGGSAVTANGIVWLKTSETEDTWANAWGIRANSPAVFNDNPRLLFAAPNAGSQP